MEDIHNSYDQHLRPAISTLVSSHGDTQIKPDSPFKF